jgi:two-component system, OmpR family, response regulator
MAKDLQRIYYAEDEDDIRLIAKLALETFGDFIVEANESGVGIVEKATDFKPDLFLLDVMMPNVDGIAAYKALADAPELKDIPVVFMTAKVQPDEVNKFREMGVADIISKPFDPQNLTERLKEIWNRYNE